ncbi:bifunctional proline dehydrogenase/L-glutamate gamma-semialdehyde dehydrogenase PutA [Pseudohongiella sp.]|uniref:L-glutamate gamma-semialdehyde dehydrogenase n=1 Tax=marine sediment metagenome TaxID=412755 RepID=A0A0F9W4G6_9ZZZZ|nr:bifunctional proline dehydrogenase/L-glutamate gamma-semialdehyde dehydrogenase PutA [Pseudohongiella sp.]HDZ09326.1 bifunctional proline dehydrogenase/L-glutamate gamma-semialdehyde dehydrogenase PutA [Pseudohongiella sp.]HEA63825.1 bifunctional proline dehydrogenase/L-glutamate gamma-semialdehyde dehydrogenase PutA [Pseudohongiella sp.]
MRYFELPLVASAAYQPVLKAYRVDETSHVRRLCQALRNSTADKNHIREQASELVATVRANRASGSGVDALMQEYQLSSQEGVVLMCLAEALLRTPDEATVDRLIEDKLGSGDWHSHLGNSESLFVNASTWGLMLSGKIIQPALPAEQGNSIFRRLVQRAGEPLVRQAVRHAMRIMARQFVMGRTVAEALERSRTAEAKHYLHSYDMLGEAARTRADSLRYLQAYTSAIHAIGASAVGLGPVKAPGISIKLSALHPRFEVSQARRVMAELVPRVLELASLAKQYDIGLTVDAEEADRLDLTLAVFEQVAVHASLAGWQGLGLAVQAYQKRAFDQIDWLADLARRGERRLMIRLVKGAYWDTEIKRAQEHGLAGYPVFTRKQNTDVSYLACAQKLLSYRSQLYPQFATHNAYTVAAILEYNRGNDDFEFQRLHGMGGPLYDQLIHADESGPRCRVYAPVGSHQDLLPYLVRRLLENGANTSFVNRILDDNTPITELVADPLEQVLALTHVPHPQIPLPVQLYPDRRNASGLDVSSFHTLKKLQSDWPENSLSDAPALSSNKDIDTALSTATGAFTDWVATDVDVRARCLEKTADLLETRMPQLMALCTTEGGKTVTDGIAEVREAADFCRYYAQRARWDFQPRCLPGPTGEDNQWRLRGRGVFVCISPWNFPLAIFLGQVSAALVAGNTVIAKAAEQTPRVAAAAVELLYQAGIPRDVLHLVTGGAETGARLVSDKRIAGVAFTGSTAAATAINRSLAARNGPIATLIAETGGLNAMLVDSSALLEQVVADVLLSGFQSAGQRCSALRILLVQDDIADDLIALLTGAMDELCIGDPAELATDVGPVIDDDALAMLNRHVAYLDSNATLRKRVELPPNSPGKPKESCFFPPQLYEISQLSQLREEVFGPIVHLLRFRADEIDSLVDAVNATGYGLTFGIHSRIDSRARAIAARIRAGNVYINRNMIGAVVGVQPFGGNGLSGTGPKAGGPLYLTRFATEQSVSTNTAAAGGNASLMTLGDAD